MPVKGWKSVTVPEEGYNIARKLCELGLEDGIGRAFEKAIKEYVKKREKYIEEWQKVRAKWESAE